MRRNVSPRCTLMRNGGNPAAEGAWSAAGLPPLPYETHLRLRLDSKLLQYPLEVVVAGVGDDDFALFRRVLDGDPRSEV